MENKKWRNMLEELLMDAFDITPKKLLDRVFGEKDLTIEEMKAIKLDDIPFRYSQTRVYLERYGIENLRDLLLGRGVWVILQEFFLRNPCYLVDIEDTVNREYDASMFEHIAGFDFGRHNDSKPNGFCVMVHNIIEAYKNEVPYFVMPTERLELCLKMWNYETELDHVYFYRQLFLQDHKPGEENKVYGWWPTAEYLKEEETKLVEAVKAVEEWDKEHNYWNGGRLYV